MLLGLQLANGDVVVVSGLEALEDYDLLLRFQEAGCRGKLRIPLAPEPNHVTAYAVDSGLWRTLENLPADRASPC